MYLAMNRFRIAAGRESDFEEMWRQAARLLSGLVCLSLSKTSFGVS